VIQLRKPRIKKTLMTALVLVILFPLFWMLSLALRSSEELATGHLRLFQRSLSFEYIIGAFKGDGMVQPLINSLIVSLSSLIITMWAGICMAYILGRRRFYSWIHKPLITWILVIRILPPISLAIPLYLMFNKMGLLGTFLPVILCHVMMNLPFVIWFLMPAFRSVPIELDESARIDGASESRVFFSVILPLITPSAVAAGIFTFMYSWNEYLYAVILVQKPSAFTLPIWLSTMNSELEVVKWGELASGGIVSVLPLLTFALLMQQYLLSGLGEGAVKE